MWMIDFIAFDNDVFCFEQLGCLWLSYACYCARAEPLQQEEVREKSRQSPNRWFIYSPIYLYVYVYIYLWQLQNIPLGVFGSLCGMKISNK